MKKTISKTFTVNLKLLILLMFTSVNCRSQSNQISLDSVLISNRYFMEIDENQRFSGPGWTFLQSNFKGKNIIGIAENHNTKEIPVFTTEVFKWLNLNEGFDYLALEQDPIMMRLISNGSLDVQGLAKKYPYGFTFITDQELEMIEQARKISSAENAIWGCDQTFGVSHVLDNIISDFRDSKNIPVELTLLKSRAREKEKVRDLSKSHYMASLGKRRDILKLKDLSFLRNNSNSSHIEALLLSDSIYGLFRKGEYFKSRNTREKYMQRLFAENYELSKGEDSTPKVLLKFGHFHLMDGFNTGSLTSNVGSMARSLAIYEGADSFVLNMQIYRNDNSEWDYLDQAYPMFSRLSNIDRWTVFDLRPLRSLDYNDHFKNQISSEFYDNWKSLIYRFDSLVIIGNGGSGTYEVTGAKF